MAVRDFIFSCICASFSLKMFVWKMKITGSRPPARDFPLGFLERDADDAVAIMNKIGFEKVSFLVVLI
jgi:hypothetical protein